MHEHYLEGTVFCGQCGSRLIVCNAKSIQGTIYPYFVCGSRHGGRGDCTRQAMLIEYVERLVEQFYDRVQISAETKHALSFMLHARFDGIMSEGAAELADLATRQTQLEDEQEKLLRAHYAGAVPLELLKGNRIGSRHRWRRSRTGSTPTTVSTPSPARTSTTH